MSKTSLFAPTTKKMVYDRIARQNDISKAELLEEFKLTSSSLTRMLEELVEDSWIFEAGFGQSTGGRKPILYRINPLRRVIFGLEISRLSSSLGLYDLNLTPLAYHKWPMDETMTPERLVEVIGESAAEMLKEHGLDQSQVEGMGIGAVGPLDRKAGIILNPEYFPAKGWENVPICQWMETRTGIKAILENGANAALIGEHWALRDDKVQHMLYVHAGTGLRSAMMSNGRLVHGAVDMEGSIGQMIIQTDGPRLHDTGNYGALEAFASVQALEKQVRVQQKLGAGRLAELGFPEEGLQQPDKIHFDLLVQALHQGYPVIRDLFEQSAAYLGVGLANLINILHPEIVILGGALISAHSSYYDKAIAVARDKIYYVAQYQPQFSKGNLQENAVSTGAAILVFDQIRI
ncbi:ROK family protein [Paenibacillus physcomitrellae]|uniref:Transcriptional regulator n=1 Tax=Paenibacillus physcomitrellae TaxID=1619311 RepID=A0ABQ1FRG5_9BACL|nr:ROK family protein [Paenibacillus physcomitrellae]GGA27979.1 transcriptional regulator [Paenibacillus physcomitrellae]